MVQINLTDGELALLIRHVEKESSLIQARKRGTTRRELMAMRSLYTKLTRSSPMGRSLFGG